jgi:hypothetical protein
MARVEKLVIDKVLLCMSVSADNVGPSGRNFAPVAPVDICCHRRAAKNIHAQRRLVTLFP